MLKSVGFEEVTTVSSGHEALQAFDEPNRRPHVVLMDERMAGKTGLETTRAIMARWPDTRVLIVSADASVRNRWEGAGAWGFIEKPVALDDLRRAVDMTLKGAEIRSGFERTQS